MREFVVILALCVLGSLGFFSPVFDPLSCMFRECCRDAIQFDANKYYANLTEKLYGQHIAIERLYYHLKAHLEDPSPRRSLALSLHGFTGVGKNYAMSMLAANLYVKGEKSRFYHFFDATVDFLHKESVEEYKAKVLKVIKEGVQDCPKSLFVFDEVHKMPSGILDAIVPLLGYAKSIQGVDYRKAIFIFMGNGGASVINEYLFNILNEGKKRTSVQYGDLRRTLALSVFNEKGIIRRVHSLAIDVYDWFFPPNPEIMFRPPENGAFEYSDLIKQHSITAVVPFLPLQEVHVTKCVEDAARRMGVEVGVEMVDFVLSELDWEPEGTRMFSTSGCKLVYDKVGFFLQQNSIQQSRQIEEL